jgi:hypothetical protein
MDNSEKKPKYVKVISAEGLEVREIILPLSMEYGSGDAGSGS